MTVVLSDYILGHFCLCYQLNIAYFVVFKICKPSIPKPCKTACIFSLKYGSLIFDWPKFSCYMIHSLFICIMVLICDDHSILFENKF